jgi:pantoate--beta-alanine ligase
MLGLRAPEKEVCMPSVSVTITELRAEVARLREERGSRVVLVPTMGALHAGHLALVRRARELGGIVVVSIFVNPLQFGPGEGLDAYPRTLHDDVAALDGLADLVFAPTVAEMYPDGPGMTRITAGPAGSLFEGASRPGHFDGMLTVVAKLFNIVRPDVAVFGQKDAQQAHLVDRMVRDLNLPIAIDVAETVRADDGLALSSRNRFLSGPEREAARALSEALQAAAEKSAQGVPAMLAVARGILDQVPEVKLDYLAVVDPSTFDSVDGDSATSGLTSVLMLVAARVGTTRLIDNVRIHLV